MAQESVGKLWEGLPLSPEITRQYPGKCIVYSEDQGKVIGVGDTERQALDQARASGVNGLWHVGYGWTDEEWI